MSATMLILEADVSLSNWPTIWHIKLTIPTF